ncbi:MAG TPA: PEGA domain-containing protein [Polyangiaceae bacterium]
MQLALERARKSESEALWDDCVRESSRVMSDAIELIGATGELHLLRELHVQEGACMSLSDQWTGARLHFLAAALLDEQPLPPGLHREEAERVGAEARDEILARPRGKVRIVTDPPGASVLIDGRPVEGVTPLEAEVRLGDHFVTLRRFRYEPNTEQVFLQPLGLVKAGLEPARRSTIGAQLTDLERRRAPQVAREELLLAKATMARAEQLLWVTPEPVPSDAIRLSLLDAASGKAIHVETVERSADDATARRQVCEVLGEECTVSASAPWYVWPLAGAVVVAGIITTVVVAENGRDTRFCPPSGCR